MTSREFYEKVKEMRSLQKTYFAKRDPIVLAQSKKAEREIDAEIERVEKIINGGEK